MTVGRCATALAICLVSAEARAQTAPPPSDAPPPSNEIVVTAPRARGDVIGHTTPEVSIGSDEIATYGAGDVGELLDDLAPQTGEKPVLLVNGKRISGGGEISKLPPEAIERFDILPEEVALAYGYKPGQRVVNIVLKQQFVATTIEASGTAATEGGRHSTKASVKYARLTAAANWSQGLPPASQRADATVVTPNVPIYDPATGATVLVDRIDGGNPALRSDDSRTLSLSATAKPLATPDLAINFGYSDKRVTDPIGMLTALTPAIEATLPDRFTRDVNGDLTTIDLRPLNFARSEQRSLKWGLFLSLPLGKAATGEDAGNPDAENDESGEQRLHFRSSGLLVASLSHSWQIENRLVLAQGGPPIDLPSGGSFGDRPAGRHRVDARVNLNKAGLGLAVDGRWQSAATLDAGGSALHFGALATMNATLFADLGSMMPDRPWTRGARIGFAVDNLFDARGRVADGAGATPLAYQDAYLDPLGRSVTLSFRKLI